MVVRSTENADGKMLTDTQIVELYWQRDEMAITESREKYGKNAPPGVNEVTPKS